MHSLENKAKIGQYGDVGEVNHKRGGNIKTQLSIMHVFNPSTMLISARIMNIVVFFPNSKAGNSVGLQCFGVTEERRGGKIYVVYRLHIYCKKSSTLCTHITNNIVASPI